MGRMRLSGRLQTHVETLSVASAPTKTAGPGNRATYDADGRRSEPGVPLQVETRG